MEPILKELIELLDSKKAENIAAINIRESSQYADSVVIVTANSLVHAQSLGHYVADFFLEKGLDRFIANRSINLNSNWILIDGGSIIVHIFLAEFREHYNLEKVYFKGELIFHGGAISQKSLPV